MKTIIFCLILLLTCGISIWHSRLEMESQYNKIEQEKKSQKQQLIRQLTEQEEACKKDRNQFRREKEDYDRRNRKLEMELSLLQEERKNFRIEIANLDKQLALMHKEKTVLKEAPATIKNQTFKSAPKSKTDLIKYALKPENYTIKPQQKNTTDIKPVPESKNDIKPAPEPKNDIKPAPEPKNDIIRPPQKQIKKMESSPFSVFPLSRKPLSGQKERLAVFFEVTPRQLLSEMEIELGPSTDTYNIEPYQTKVRIENNRLIFSSPPPGAYRLYFSAPVAGEQKIRWKFTSLLGHKGSHEIRL
jgi:hypothetical protein